jgi:cellulose biosynthesis protein BcsQ
MAVVVGVVGRKGGQGKSTLAVSLAAGAVSGKRPRPLLHSNGAILVDADSQSNASRWALDDATIDGLGRLQTVAALEVPPRLEYLPEESPLRSATSVEELVEIAVRDCLFDAPKVPGLRVVPSCPRVHPDDAQSVALKWLPADVVIVDTGADCSTPLVRSVIAQADYVVVPTVAEPWGYEGVRQTVHEIQSVGRRDLLDSGRVSVVISRRERLKVQDVLEASLRDALGSMVSRIVVPKTAAVGLVSGGPEYLTARHVLRGLVASLWADIFSTLDTKELAA